MVEVVGGCGYEKVGRHNSISHEDFIAKARAVHGNKYDYTNTIYEFTDKPVEIYCKSHSIYFKQTPNSHLGGSGCPECAKESSANGNRLTKEEFVIRANITHKEKYDYSKVEYVNSNTMISIICPEHGVFSQRSGCHLQGHGCAKCGAQNSSGIYSDKKPIPEPEKDVQGILYLVEMTNPKRSFYKIGVTRQESVARRMKKLKQTDCTYREISQVKTNMYDVRLMEREIFAKLEEAKLRYKIHDMQGNPNGGWTECFPICQEVDDIIKDFFPIN